MDDLQIWKINAKLKAVLLDFSKAYGKRVVTESQQESLALLGNYTYIISFNPKTKPVSGRELNKY